METHFSILAWRIPWIEEPGGPWSKGLQRVRHNEVTKVCLHNISVGSSVVTNIPL